LRLHDGGRDDGGAEFEAWASEARFVLGDPEVRRAHAAAIDADAACQAAEARLHHHFARLAASADDEQAKEAFSAARRAGVAREAACRQVAEAEDAARARAALQRG
jgi:hypothetical protein